jgi:N6-adenosine-specific RNA methylase IME4
MTRYRTIVADPPWDHADGYSTQSRTNGVWEGEVRRAALPYARMSVHDICRLPVVELAESDARLFLWATNRYLPDAFGVIEAWRFRYVQALVWHKRDGNMGGSLAPNAEFLLVAVRGAPARLGRLPSAVILTSQPKVHSTKPDLFLDHVEQLSPGPYLELFARRQRLGWDTWGLECFKHIELGAPA